MSVWKRAIGAVAIGAGVFALVAAAPGASSATTPRVDRDTGQDAARQEDRVYRDLAYGEHARQRLDLFVAPGATAEDPAPVVLYFHGGGFRKGDKDKVSERFIASMHRAGISVAAVNYRFFTTDPLPAAMHDGARAVQYLRHHADRYGIDADRVGVTGSSAGAGISLWIAFHDDLGDAEAEDPVARESTRVSAALVKGAQVSYDETFWRELGLDRIVDARSFGELVGYDGSQGEESAALARAQAAIAEASPITHLSAGDPPVRMDYGAGLEITERTTMGELLHHPSHGVAWREACEKVGVSCQVYYPGGIEPTENGSAFLIRLLTE